MNGVKIAVPIAKMSGEDISFVEQLTGLSLDDDKPLSEPRRSKSAKASPGQSIGSVNSVGATIDTSRKQEYDWFQFFLSCDVTVGLCERYAQAFLKDSMDESVLPDIDAAVLRTLGLKEGDIIKVMKTLDSKFGRAGSRTKADPNTISDGEGNNTPGGLFSGPGGTLRNNTRKGRPAPAVQTSDVVDPKAFSKPEGGGASENASKTPSSTTAKTVNESKQSLSGGFDDNAWDVKPTKQESAQEQKVIPQVRPIEPPRQTLTGSMQELSLLTTPLQPTKVEQESTPSVTSPPPGQSTMATPVTNPQPPGATPSFFSANNQHTGPTSFSQAPHPADSQSFARQRPAAPQFTPSQGSLMPPPPQRPLSAPQSAQPSAFSPPPLVPQMTGVATYQTQVAPTGQSLSEINQARIQQQQQQQFVQHIQQQMQAPPALQNFPLQQTGQPLLPFHAGAQSHPGQFMQPLVTGMQPIGHGPFVDPSRQAQYPVLQPQPTGFPAQFGSSPPFAHAPTAGINTFLPPPLEPQRTGIPGLQVSHPANVAAFNPTGVNAVPPPQQPLLPQQTGPAPAIRFGVTGDSRKLVPQPTGRRANLSQASKSLLLCFYFAPAYA
jgi:actin cytoskeleton-regulatory complex protein SLA1